MDGEGTIRESPSRSRREPMAGPDWRFVVDADQQCGRGQNR